MYIDTHCHLSYKDYDDIDKVIEDNKNAGIDKIIISGCTKESMKESLELSNKYNNIYVTLGYHPSEAGSVSDEDLYELERMLLNSNVIGIGEIGLDYHYGREDMELQKELFRKQLEIAQKNNLPVVIHTRDATSDTISILKEFSDVRGDIHCFSGSIEVANIYISLGYYLGIGGVVTFKNSNLYKVVKEIGLNHILLETDSPYLTPEPYRGYKNSSKNIPYIAKKISEILSVSVEDVANYTVNNTISLFDLK